MIELYLNKEIREELLSYDINNSEHCFDRDMYYITTSENQILYDIIYNYGDEDVLKEAGFKEKDIELIFEEDVNIKFTDEKEYYIKEVE